MNCPLCTNSLIHGYHRDNTREYVQCSRCFLVFVPQQYHLSPNQERQIYELHQNDPEDQGYRKFLSRLALPLLKHLSLPAQGLDFGCGPGPALWKMFAEHGFSMDLYDPFFYLNPKVFSRRYDFICTSEVAEHLRMPGEEFSRLFKMLRPGGCLGVMTKLVKNREAFAHWHYIRDCTHISFFSKATFMYIARMHNAQLYFYGSDVVVLKKHP